MRQALVLAAAALIATTVWATGPVNRTDPAFTGTGQVGLAPEAGTDDCPGTPVGALPFSDPGNTCGATNNITTYGGVCGTNLPFPYGGEDHVYQITLGTGNNVEFSADLTDSTGDLVLYLLTTCGDGNSCVANSQDSIGAGAGPELIAATAYTPGTYYVYIDSYYNAGAAGSCGSYTLSVTGTVPAELVGFSAE